MFYIFGLTWTVVVLYDHMLELWEIIGFPALYSIYILYAIVAERVKDGRVTSSRLLKIFSCFGYFPGVVSVDQKQQLIKDDLELEVGLDDDDYSMVGTPSALLLLKRHRSLRVLTPHIILFSCHGCDHRMCTLASFGHWSDVNI